MKITKNQNTMTIQQSGYGQFIGGLIFAFIGLATSVISINLIFSHGAPWWALLFGPAFLFMGGWSLLLAKNRTVTLSHNEPSCISDKRIFAGKVSDIHFDLTDVMSLHLQFRRTSGSTHISELVLLTEDSSQITLLRKRTNNRGYIANGMNIGALLRKTPLGRESEEIANFIGAPLEMPQSSFETFKDLLGKANNNDGSKQPSHVQVNQSQILSSPKPQQAQDNKSK